MTDYDNEGEEMVADELYGSAVVSSSPDYCAKCGAAKDNHAPGGSRFGVCVFVSSSPDIPDEANEAAAIAVHKAVQIVTWAEAKDAARAALAAAYPALTRQAVRRAWQEGKDSDHTIQCRLGDGDCSCENPYDPLGTESAADIANAARIARAEPGTDERTDHE